MIEMFVLLVGWYLAPFDAELVKLDPVLPEEPRVLLRVRLRAQVPDHHPKQRCCGSRSPEARAEAVANRVSRRLHDGAQVEGEQEAEVVGVREARAEDAVVDHGEVERRHQGAAGLRLGEREGEPRRVVLPQVNAEGAHGLVVLLRVLAPLPRRDLQLHGAH
jgi:hypothetical protein